MYLKQIGLGPGSGDTGSGTIAISTLQTGAGGIGAGAEYLGTKLLAVVVTARLLVPTVNMN